MASQSRVTHFAHTTNEGRLALQSNFIRNPGDRTRVTCKPEVLQHTMKKGPSPIGNGPAVTENMDTII
jgi:hypothetical protein